jgi:hypothetical protein
MRKNNGWVNMIERLAEISQCISHIVQLMCTNKNLKHIIDFILGPS